MKLNKNDIYNFLTKGHFMNVDIYSKPFQQTFVNRGGGVSYSFGGDSYSEVERNLFKESARKTVMNQYPGLEIYEGIDFTKVNKDGIYFDTKFENDDFKYKLDVVVYQGGVKTIYEFKNSTKWQDQLLIRYFTIMTSLKEEAYKCNFRFVIYERSTTKGAVGSKILDDFVLMGKSTINFDLIWKNRTQFEFLSINRAYLKKDGSMMKKFERFIDTKHNWFQDNFDGLVNITKRGKDNLSSSLELAISEGAPLIRMIPIDSRIKQLFDDKKFVPKEKISAELMNSMKNILYSLENKELIFFDFETLNPKISLFNNYPSTGNGVPAQTSIYSSNVNNLLKFTKIDSIMIDTFTVDDMSSFFPVISKLFSADAQYITHSKYERSVLNTIKNDKGTPLDIVEKIDYINSNTLDTSILFKDINQYDASSIKIIEKFLKTQDGIYSAFELEDYTDLDISNGFQAMDAFLNMQLFGDTEPYRGKDVEKAMTIYCDQDVRMMVALLYWWKEKWLPNIKIIKEDD